MILTFLCPANQLADSSSVKSKGYEHHPQVKLEFSIQNWGKLQVKLEFSMLALIC